MLEHRRRRRLALTGAVLLFLTACLPASAAAPAKNGNVLRLHVIANSDSAEDQRVKLLVRDAVLAVMEPGETAGEARQFVLENGGALLSAAERALQENGADYGAQLQLGRFRFPDRTYGDAFYPAGDYEALRIVLGDGAGQNWWCVLFPPLCLIAAEEAPEDGDGEIRFTSTIWNWLHARRTEHENIQ